MAETKPAVVQLAFQGVAVAPDASIDADELARMWNLFAKCKSNLQDGRRLENLSWRLWHQTTFRPLPPVASSASIAHRLAHHQDQLSDPEGGASDSSLSDASPPSSHYSSSQRGRSHLGRHVTGEGTPTPSSAPTSTTRPQTNSPGPVPARMSPSSLQNLIHKVLEPAETKWARSAAPPRSEAASSLPPPPPGTAVDEDATPCPSVPHSQTPPGPSIAQRMVAVDVPPPREGASEAGGEASSPGGRSVATSVRSKYSESSTHSSRAKDRRIVHHVHGHGHHRPRHSVALRRNASERAMAMKSDVGSPAPLTPAQQLARPAMPRRQSSQGQGEKQVKQVRIIEDPAAGPSMARTPSQDRPAHHRRNSSNMSTRSNPRSGSSMASLTSLEPQSVVYGFQPGSSSASVSSAAATALATSPVKPSSLRNSFIVREPTPPSGSQEEESPHAESSGAATQRVREHSNRSRMFFVGSEQAGDGDNDSSSGWGSDFDELDEAGQPSEQQTTPQTPATRTSIEPTHEANLFAKRPVRSAADLASAASTGDMSRTASQGLLTALFSTDPFALARQAQRPAEKAAALLPSRSAVTLPSRRLGGPPPDVELSDDDDDDEQDLPAMAQARPFRISNVGARAVVPAPMQLSASQTRRNMLTTELSESLRRNLLWERQSQPGARDRRVVDRRAAAAARQPSKLASRPAMAPASVAVDTTNYFANQYHRQGW